MQRDDDWPTDYSIDVVVHFISSCLITSNNHQQRQLCSCSRGRSCGGGGDGSGGGGSGSGGGGKIL